MRKIILLPVLACFLGLTSGYAQTTLNPDVSLVGSIRIFSHNDTTRPSESEEVNFCTPNMELVVAGYLNPYARADAVIAWEGEENAEVEELYATMLRGLPLRMNLRVGKYRLDFGRLNPVHPHAYSFIDQPLPHEEFFGEEGLNDMAVRVSFLLPTGKLCTELMGAVLKGDALRTEEDTEETEGEEAADETRIKPGFLGRLTTSGAVSDNGELALGASVVTSEYDPPARLRACVYGLDLKYKWKPSRNTSLTLEGEGLASRRDKIEGGAATSYGGWGYIDYRFGQKYNLGSLIEYTESKSDNDDHVFRVGGFVGFAPIEETSLVRLAGSWTKPKETDGFWTATIQFVFSLGPHQPHNF